MKKVIRKIVVNDNIYHWRILGNHWIRIYNGPKVFIYGQYQRKSSDYRGDDSPDDLSITPRLIRKIILNKLDKSKPKSLLDPDYSERRPPI